MIVEGPDIDFNPSALKTGRRIAVLLLAGLGVVAWYGMIIVSVVVAVALMWVVLATTLMRQEIADSTICEFKPYPAMKLGDE